MAAALQDRVRLMEQRADGLIARARAAKAPWLAQLGSEPADSRDTAAWRARARTVVAYRERHQITDTWSALGIADGGNAQQRREEVIASRSLTPSVRPPAEPLGRTTGVPSPASPLDPIGR